MMMDVCMYIRCSAVLCLAYVNSKTERWGAGVLSLRSECPLIQVGSPSIVCVCVHVFETLSIFWGPKMGDRCRYLMDSISWFWQVWCHTHGGEVHLSLHYGKRNLRLTYTNLSACLKPKRRGVDAFVCVCV